jgi:hypothetical protein
MEASGQLHVPTVSPPGKEPPGTHCIEGCVRPRTGFEYMSNLRPVILEKSRNAWSRGSCQYSDWTTGWMTGVQFPGGAIMEMLLMATVSTPALGPSQPPIQWVSGALFLWVKRPEREADHFPPFSTEVKNTWSSTTTPLIRLHGVVLS